MKKDNGYFIGLDCGTNSVGWAVTDTEYNILRARGKRLWGLRLFDEAETAADRRIYRSSRRRNRRTKARLKLLQDIFSEEMAKVDPDFYIRLRESFFLEEDKQGLIKKSKNTLFNDKEYTDKDYHKEYPTIWHLRQAIINAGDNKHFDLRQYFLAIQHILKHRGHFLYEGKLDSGNINFTEIFQGLIDISSRFDLEITDTVVDNVEEIIKSKDTKTNKKKRLKDLGIFIESEKEEDEKLLKKRQDELIALLVGSKVTPQKIFINDVDKEAKTLSFDSGDFEETQQEIADDLGDADKMDLIFAAKKIYDYGILSNLLGTHQNISAAMVANYDLHEKELKELKSILKQYDNDYKELFKSGKVTKGAAPCYGMYIGNTYEEDGNGRRKSVICNQEDINKQIEKVLEKHNITGDLLEKAKNRELLPKQRGQAKGTIPQQLHHNELEAILKKLAKDFPSFGEETDEPKEYNTKVKKILSIHSFRIPYYCGPIVSKRKSQFSWANEEISELVRPWNFNNLVHLDERADEFIKRMTNQCTYLIDESVLPKCSILYQKYMVLNELNNLKINGVRLEDINIKQQIFERAFVGGELKGNVTIKTLKCWLVNNSLLREDDDLSGASEVKILPKYSTDTELKKALGDDYLEKYGVDKIEAVIDAATVLNEEKRMLARKIASILGDIDEDAALTIAKKLKFKDWGRFSKKLLTGIFADVNGRKMSILDALYETNCNFMELLGNEYGFKSAIDKYNEPLKPISTEVTYKDVENLYCSPAVKRTVWQTIRIIDEIIKVMGHAPEKIFLEVTRGNDNDKKGKNTLSRYKQLQELYKNIKSSEDFNDLIHELDSKEPRDLQQKKLYLYFTQMGRCAYSGERIDLEELETDLYDIDHIYPRSKTKDDSITRNLVLVKAKLNREKTNTYPISSDIREHMRGIWAYWLKAGLITKDKYQRLTRSTPLSIDEMSGFISRQLVETSQSVKAIRDLLERKFQNNSTAVVMVKAGQVSDFRNWFGYDHIDKETGAVGQKGRAEFIKVRAINDLHHAKDAYLNIVVGNVINETFTSNPYKWLKNNESSEWSMNSHVLWNEDPEKYKFVKAWHNAETVEKVSGFMKRNDILYTKMCAPASGALSDQKLVGRSSSSGEIMPIKKIENGRYDPQKYGGYNKIGTSYFALIEIDGARKIIQIPIIASHFPEQYILDKYGNAKVVIPKIYPESLLIINNFPLRISGKTGNNFVTYPALQAFFDYDACAYIKKLVKVVEKDKMMNKCYKIDEARDKVSIAENEKLLDIFNNKLVSTYSNMITLKSKIQEIISCKNNFMNLDIKDQCSVLCQYANIFACNKVFADLSAFVPSSKVVGRATFSSNISNLDSIKLVIQSPTGLYEKVIDLKTYEPKS